MRLFDLKYERSAFYKVLFLLTGLNERSYL